MLQMMTYLPRLSSLLVLWVSAAHGQVLPKEASPDTPWEDLKAVLSSPDILTPGIASEWQEECVQIFEDVTEFPEVDGTFAIVTNYLLMNQTSGLCLDAAACAYENCNWPPTSASWPYYPPGVSPYVINPGFNDLAEGDLELETLLLPAMVLQPTTAADIVRAVEFCQANDVGITVKVAGHSYFGASTAKNTLLIKMNPEYPKYGIEGSLTECANVEDADGDTIPSANQMACALATARGKNAVMRVGGGELFDEAYRAVSIEWNSENENRYHLVGGGAGTVSAAGGWLASGGLSGTTGMRMYGVGIDQVLAMEMVLPSGQHVRFGPTEWTEVDGGYPKTTTVTGYCNNAPYEVDEELWEWTECEEGSIDFNELWFAARGGGGGTYGILTSLHYQLHDYPGLLTMIQPDPGAFPEGVEEMFTEESAYVFSTKYIEFLLKYLWVPESLNVTEADSRGCNSAQTLNLNVFLGGQLFCYGSSAATILAKWVEFITDPEVVAVLEAVGIPDEIITAAPNLFINASTWDSYAEQGISNGAFFPGVPPGRMADLPLAAVVSILGGYPNLVDSYHTLFPLEVIRADPVGMAELLAFDVLTTRGGSVYAQGGAIPESDDGMNSLSPSRRNAAFLMSVDSEEIRDTYYSFFYGTLDQEGDFPGSSCHNHANVYEMGPVKTNWSQSCPLAWTQAEREENCISQNEAAWGTANLARLEAFKVAIDPNNLFICTSGVGYSNPAQPDDPWFVPSLEQEDDEADTSDGEEMDVGDEGDPPTDEEGSLGTDQDFPEEESEDTAAPSGDALDVERKEGAELTEPKDASAAVVEDGAAVSGGFMTHLSLCFLMTVLSVLVGSTSSWNGFGIKGEWQ